MISSKDRQLLRTYRAQFGELTSEQATAQALASDDVELLDYAEVLERFERMCRNEFHGHTFA